MPAFTGRLLLLKEGSGTAATTIAAMRETGFTINGETVDVTSKDSTGQFRELLSAGGVVSLSVKASGLLFGDTSTHNNLVSRCIARTLNSYRIEYDNNDTLEGSFQVTNFEASGTYNGEQTYSVSLESSGSVTSTRNA